MKKVFLTIVFALSLMIVIDYQYRQSLRRLVEKTQKIVAPLEEENLDKAKAIEIYKVIIDLQQKMLEDCKKDKSQILI